MSEETIVNRVSGSGLITLNLEDYYESAEKVELDIKPWLFRELMLKEKEFREFVQQHPWENYQGKIVCFTCSTDAIVPTWAYMLLGVSVQPYAKRFFFGSIQQIEELLFHEALSKIDYAQFAEQRVIVKGCGDIPIPINAYVEITSGLLPYAKSIMYGEACSNVPVYKKKK